jgi:TRAP-type uncharacterized transport system fused permease subunit
MRLRTRILLALAIGAAAFHPWAAGVAPFTALEQRPVHLLFMALMGFLGLGIAVDGGATESADADGPAWRKRAITAWRALMVAGAIFTCGYIILENESLVRRAGAATPLDLVAGGIAIVVVLALARRTTGLGLVTVAGLALGYALAGPWLPGILAHRGYSLRRLIEHLYLTSEGIWGIPLGVSADFVYLFVLFGAIMAEAVVGRLFGPFGWPVWF